jgi:hypothetical protein
MERDTGMDGVKEMKKMGEGWRHERTYSPLNFTGI